MAEYDWTGCGSTNTTTDSCISLTADLIRYVNKVDTDSGWLMVRSSNGELCALFKYCKLSLLGTKKGRVYFKILEGTYSGSTASLSKDNADAYLGKIAPIQSPAELVVSYGKYIPNWVSVARNGQILKQQFATATIDGISFQTTMNTVWPEDQGYDGFYPIPSGKYNILLPDQPHNRNMTAFYKNAEPSLSNHQVWFPIKYGNHSRYVHVGNVSDGCTTVIDLKKWADIEEALIKHRGPDSASVGILTVKGIPERQK